MTTNINADNGVVSGVAGLKTSADNSGVLALQTNGTTALTVNASQAIGVGSTPSYGTSGQVLTSAGSGASPTWTTATSSQWTTSGSNIYYNTGNVGIGTASPSGILQVNGVQDGVAGKNARFSYNGTYYLEINELSIRSFNNPLIFGTGTSGTERMQIDASGNLLIALTSQVGAGTVCTTNSATKNGVVVKDSASGSYLYSGLNSSNSSVLLILGSGNVQNANNSYGAISDVKLKENIVDATPKLDKLMKVRVRNYNLKGDYEQHKQIGVIAQELETVFPAMVDETPDKDEEGNDLGTTTKSVKYSVFVPMLIKAIQELKAEFDAYKASHP